MLVNDFEILNRTSKVILYIYKIEKWFVTFLQAELVDYI